MSVTKQQQIEWLAKQVKNDVQFDRIKSQFDSDSILSCLIMSVTDIGVFSNLRYDHFKITREEWCEERDKIETKAKDSSLWYEQDMSPPIGTECEFRYKYSDKGRFEDWNQGTIKYIGNDLFVAEVKGKELAYNNLDVFEFRPAINKRDKAIEDMLLVLTDLDGCSLKDIVSALYDAGYDKPFTQGTTE
ncbi:hypothetical protein KLEP7_gp117 [Pseudaeromonas phage vB_PpeM_ KLEP7]|nr:hypothetical protein KLEP7_gp117 [Pseudaeromonas phage vB_PpeM_ KLEP7]